MAREQWRVGDAGASSSMVEGMLCHTDAKCTALMICWLGYWDAMWVPTIMAWLLIIMVVFWVQFDVDYEYCVCAY